MRSYRVVSRYDACHVGAVSARVDADAEHVALLEDGDAKVEVVDGTEAPALAVHLEATHSLKSGHIAAFVTVYGCTPRDKTDIKGVIRRDHGACDGWV
jgi:hypothetical protein